MWSGATLGSRQGIVRRLLGTTHGAGGEFEGDSFPFEIHEYRSGHAARTPGSGVTSMVMPSDNPRLNDAKEARATCALPAPLWTPQQ
jgi:hypothetical protein